jgi:hypothetical protein
MQVWVLWRGGTFALLPACESGSLQLVQWLVHELCIDVRSMRASDLVRARWLAVMDMALCRWSVSCVACVGGLSATHDTFDVRVQERSLGAGTVACS